MSLKVYRGRTLARSQALQLLFQAEATDSPLERVLEGDFLISKGPLDPYALELCRGAYEHIDRIDCALRAVAKNWDLMRMPGADRNLLRIAVYEMRFLTDEEVSDAIVINEAVEIAKAYGTDQSASFVNGVLGKRGAAGRGPVPRAAGRGSRSRGGTGCRGGRQGRCRSGCRRCTGRGCGCC